MKKAIKWFFIVVIASAILQACFGGSRETSNFSSKSNTTPAKASATAVTDTIKVDGQFVDGSQTSVNTKFRMKFTVKNTGKSDIDDLVIQGLDMSKYLVITDPSGNAIDGDYVHFGTLDAGAQQTFVIVGYPRQAGNWGAYFTFYNYTGPGSYDQLTDGKGNGVAFDGNVTILP